jgi:flagellar biosynthesis protein FlhG
MTHPQSLAFSKNPAASKSRSTGDQAQALRGLMQRLQSDRAEPTVAPRSRRAFAIGVTSGKGGVGKTNIALNLAIALARLDAGTCLVDANLGLGNIDLLCGLNGYWNLSHVVSGARNVRDIVLAGPEGINVIPGASGLTELADCPASAQADLFRQLTEFEESHDFLVIDTSAGIHRPMREFLNACDLVLVVTTPEPTSIADSYALIKTLSGSDIPHLEVLVNQSDSAPQAHQVAERIQQTARMFLHLEVAAAGFVPKDPQVPAAVVRRRPFLIETPESPASAAIQQLAARLKRLFERQPAQTTAERGSFFPRMQTHRVRRAA